MHFMLAASFIFKKGMCGHMEEEANTLKQMHQE